MTRITPWLAIVAGVLAVSAGAQATSDKARVDDFAVTQERPGSEVPQLDPSRARQPVEASQGRDRSLAVPTVPGEANGPVAQISRHDDRPAPAQLTSSAESRQVASRSVSSAGDSRPQAAAALGGQDRCAAGSAAERTAECQRIIERRAGEFNAREAPRLSAEQVLLATTQNEDRLADNSSRVLHRVAGATEPDAEDASNQELAAIYLQRLESGQPVQPTDPEPTAATDTAAAQILQALQIGPGAIVTPGK